MTCEIAALNRSAIALAADRKMSWTSESGDALHRDATQKLFELSEVHPVGFMTNGNGDYADCGPWDVLVRDYVAYKGGACHETIAQWGEDFLSFVKAYGNGDKDDKGERLEIILDKMFEAFEVTTEATADALGIDMSANWDSAIESKILKLSAESAVLTPSEIRALKRRYTDVVDFVVADRGPYMSDKKLAKRAKTLAWMMISHGEFSSFHSGIVIGGYGSKQRFPALVAYNVEGYLGGVFKAGKTHERDLNLDPSASLMSFAQADMIRAFLSGADEFAERFLFHNLTKELMACLDESASALGLNAQQKAMLHDRFATAYQNLDISFEEEKDKRASAVVRGINQLDAASLGTLAQSLVSLEAMRHFYGNFPPSVGGGCDVLVMRHTDRRVSVERVGMDGR